MEKKYFPFLRFFFSLCQKTKQKFNYFFTAFNFSRFFFNFQRIFRETTAAKKKSMKRKINNSNSEDFQLSLCNAEFYVGVLEIDVLCCTSPSKSVSFVNSHVSHMCSFSVFTFLFHLEHINVEQAHVMS